MPRRVGERAPLLGRIEESNDDVDDGDASSNVNPTDSVRNCLGRYAYSTILSAALAVVCALLFLQLLGVQYQLRKEQREIDHLVDVIEHEQNAEIEHLNKRVEQEHEAAIYHIAGTFVLISSLITMFHMRAHIKNMHVAVIQRKILAILLMSPIYAITSFLSVVFLSISEYLAIIKDCYEAYVIYTFLSFLISVLGKGKRNVVVELLARHADSLRPPLSCLKCLYYPDPSESDDAMANAVLLECQVLALQFVFLRPLLSISLFVLQTMRHGDEPMALWDIRSPLFYIVMIQNLSVFGAFSGLLKLYHAVHEYCEYIQPFQKFMCIKGIVFITFWQGLLISFLANVTFGEDGAEDDNGMSPEEWSIQVQNILICLEMLGFSIAHFFVFPVEEWEEGYIRKHLGVSVGDSIAFGDFVSDVKMIYSSGRSARAESQRKVDNSTVASASTTLSEDFDNENDIVLKIDNDNQNE